MACCCCCRCRSPKSWLCSACLCLVGSVFFFLQAYWAFNLHQSLTPVFTDIDCHLKFPKIQKVSFKGGFHVDFTAITECFNPNPYIIAVKSTAPVNVYMGKKGVKIAEVRDIAPAYLKPDKTGQLVVNVRMQPTRKSWGVMFGSMFTALQPIYVENSIAIEVDVNLFFMRLKVKKDFVRNCGFNLQLFRGGAFAKAGALNCADTWEDLEVPEIDDANAGFMKSKGQLILPAMNLAEDEIKTGTKMKDIGLGIAMIAGVGWGVVLMLGCCYCIYRSQRADARSGGIRRGNREELMRDKLKHQARELRTLKAQLAQEELRRKLAAREKKLRALQARLGDEDSLGLSVEEQVSPVDRKVAKQERELKALRAKLARKDPSDDDLV